jgi:hypothetical protein
MRPCLTREKEVMVGYGKKCVRGMLHTCHNRRPQRRECCEIRRMRNCDSRGTLSFRSDSTRYRMARKTALEIEMKRCVHACARAETTGERAAKKGALVALLRESRKKGRRKRTYGFECADGLRGAGTSQRIKGPKLKEGSVSGTYSRRARTYRSNSKARSRARVEG